MSKYVLIFAVFEKKENEVIAKEVVVKNIAISIKPLEYQTFTNIYYKLKKCKESGEVKYDIGLVKWL